MNKFFQEFNQFIWTWNPDKSFYSTIIYDAYGNTFEVTITDFMLNEHNIKDTSETFRRWIKKPFEFDWSNPEHQWFKSFRNNILIKQLKKVGN